MTDSSSPTWHLVRTRPLSEYKAADGLERNGYEFYFPRATTPKPRPGRDDAPLFPGYLFVRNDGNGSRLPPLNRVDGVLGWVQFDGVVPEVPDEVITELSRRIKEIGERGGHWRRFMPGETVRVTSGWMNSLAKVVAEPDSPQTKVRVLLDFMDRLVNARVPWADLEPADVEQSRSFAGRRPRRTRGRGRWIRGYGPRTPEVA